VQQTLLAVDHGLRIGLALTAADGDLLWFRSHHFPSKRALCRMAWALKHAVAFRTVEP
jgi:hypothetical protein